MNNFIYKDKIKVIPTIFGYEKEKKIIYVVA